ncbi:uncharacterized protein LOC134188776 [Corticium candelabrum]|uniref:uncharacterized protein LOC134188776 n=1 Tax=Corticium candelabrum TaxID=121492 RepID=UPI002E258588|nr:uncharacterized protein LOC134188776 [Corticium candelabrum]
MTSRYLLSRLFVITILLHLNQQTAINSEKFLDLTVREPAGSCPVRYVPEPLDPLPASMENALKEFENALNLQINKTLRQPHFRQIDERLSVQMMPVCNQQLHDIDDEGMPSLSTK